MREMDILLGRFLERGYDTLDDAERAVFERLLDQPDQDILGWLCGASDPADADFASLVSRMRTVVDGP